METGSIRWEDLHPGRFFVFGTSLFLGLRGLLHPLFLIKTRLQAQTDGAYRGPVDAVRTIVRQEGVGGLYRGFWVSNVSLILRQGYFLSYEFLRSSTGPGTPLYETLGDTRGALASNFVSGCGASVLMQFLSVPCEVVTQRLMVQREGGGDVGSAVGMIRGIYRESGLRGFYRGFAASVLQYSPTSGLWWLSYTYYKAQVRSALPVEVVGDSLEEVSSSLAGLMSGTTTVMLTNPLDTVRVRLQVQERSGSSATNGIVSELRSVVAAEGVRGLYRGLAPRLFAVAPASLVMISVYDTIKRLSLKEDRKEAYYAERRERLRRLREGARA